MSSTVAGNRYFLSLKQVQQFQQFLDFWIRGQRRFLMFSSISIACFPITLICGFVVCLGFCAFRCWGCELEIVKTLLGHYRDGYRTVQLLFILLCSERSELVRIGNLLVMWNKLFG
jgi:hypothetical protein